MLSEGSALTIVTLARFIYIYLGLRNRCTDETQESETPKREMRRGHMTVISAGMPGSPDIFGIGIKGGELSLIWKVLYVNI